MSKFKNKKNASIATEELSFNIEEDEVSLEKSKDNHLKKDLELRKSKFRIAIQKEASYISSIKQKELVDSVREGKVRLKKKVAQMKEDKHSNTQRWRKKDMKSHSHIYHKSGSGYRPQSRKAKPFFKKADKEDPRVLKLDFFNSERSHPLSQRTLKK